MRALRQAQHAQHGAVVEVALREVARGDAHRHRRQQRRQQRHQVEELLGAVQRLAHLGPAALQRLDAHAAQRHALDAAASAQRTNSRTAASPRWRSSRRRGHGQPVADAAGRLHQAGGVAGRPAFSITRGAKLDEAGAAVGLDDDDARDLQARRRPAAAGRPASAAARRAAPASTHTVPGAGRRGQRLHRRRRARRAAAAGRAAGRPSLTALTATSREAPP